MRAVHGLGLAVALVAGLGAVGAAAAAPPANVEWSQHGGGPDHNNHRPGANVVRFPKVLWRVPGVRGQPTIADGHLFAGGDRLVRIDPRDGEVVAAHTVAGKGDVRVFEAPALTPTLVIARSTDGRVLAMDHYLREVKWSWQGPELQDARWSGVLVHDDAYVFVAPSVGSHGPGQGDWRAAEVVALSPQDGTVLWRSPLAAGEEAWTTPAADGGKVYVGTEKGRFMALSLSTGEPVWTHQGESKYRVTMPVVVDGRVVMGDRGIQGVRSGAVNAFDVKDGTLLWSTEFGATGFSSPGVTVDAAGKASIVAGFGRSVALFDLETGKRAAQPAITTGNNAFGSPTVIGDTVCFGNLDGRFYVHDLATGALRWAFELPASPDPKKRTQVYDFTYAHGRLYMSSSLGLFALGQDPEAAVAPAGFVLRWTDPDAKPEPAPTPETPAPTAGPARGSEPTAGRTPHTLAEAWTRDALQIRDPALRERTIAAVRAALEGEDGAAAHGALLTLARLGQVAYDKTSFRPLVLARLKASTGLERVAAANALHQTSREPSDLALVLPIADDPEPEARRAASYLFRVFGDGTIDGPAAVAVERLLDTKDARLLLETLRGLWGAKVTPGIEQRLLALAAVPANRHDAVYFGLSTLQDKSERVVDTLVDALGDPHHATAERARWGLGHGVPVALHGRAADGLVLLLQARSDPTLQVETIRLLAAYGGEAHAQTLDALAANAQASAAVREAATDAAAKIRARLARGG